MEGLQNLQLRLASLFPWQAISHSAKEGRFLGMVMYDEFETENKI